METGLIILAAFNAIMLFMITCWWFANCCTLTFSWVGCNPTLDDEDEESDSSGTPSPPAFDRNRKPALSILKNKVPQNGLSDEIVNIDNDPFVQAHFTLNNLAAKPLEKRARFEEPPLM